MKAYDVKGTEVSRGIPVSTEPYAKIAFGEGGHKRATWIPLGKNDANSIVVKTPITTRKWNGQEYETVETGNFTVTVEDVGVIALKDKNTGEPNGRFLIVAPRNGSDNRILVLWRVSSGYRGSASIKAGEGVTVIGSDQSWHSGRGSLGSTAEMLAILKPGQELRASRSGRRVQENRARLTWDGKEIKVVYGDDSLFDVVGADEPEGDYI